MRTASITVMHPHNTPFEHNKQTQSGVYLVKEIGFKLYELIESTLKKFKKKYLKF
jgi:hypothetical protein